jgi:type VI secretion system protein ImpL
MQEALHKLTQLPRHKRMTGCSSDTLSWYVMLGASQSGKTTLLRSVAHATAPFAHQGMISEGPTQDCDWWFLNTAVVLDTAGYYVHPTETDHEHSAWCELLSLLRRYRRRQPLQGVIVTVATDTLIVRSQDEVRDEALALRARLNEALQLLRRDFPVYLFLTHCDHIAGWTEFCGCFPEHIRQQALGVLQKQWPPAGDFCTTMCTSLDTRLHQLQLAVYNKAELPERAHRQKIFCFLEEWRALQTPLRTFVDVLCSANQWQYQPAPRGLFLSSARQSGSPISMLRRQWHCEDQQNMEEGTLSYGLHDFFTVILPRDQALLKHMGKTRPR